jgi:hypothetical protein
MGDESEISLGSADSDILEEIELTVSTGLYSTQGSNL